MSYIDRKRKNNKINKIQVNLPISTIDSLIYYSLSMNDLVTVGNLFNLRRYINLIDIESSFNEENELPSIQHLRLLIEILDSMIEYTVDSFEELKDFIKNKTDESYIPESIIDTIFEYNEEYEFDDKKVIYWNKFIQNQLDYASIYQYLPTLKNIINSFEHPEPKSNEIAIPLAKETLTNLNRVLNMNTMSLESKLNSFDITDRTTAKKIIKQSLERLFNPGNRISTGYRLLDKMLGGGMEGERCYLLLGVAKSFKSGTLLNIALNVVTNYVDYQLKDPEKTPVVLYFTMENSMIETFIRIYRYLGLVFDFKYKLIKNKKGKTVKKYLINENDVDTILTTIERETIEKTGIALRIEFRTHMSVDTGELDKLYENYSLINNQEIILIVQDYIKRIHSQRNFKTSEKRDELGEVINEFCNFAKTKDIPILTASQLNREALKSIEKAKNGNKKDLGRKLNGSQVGESNLVYENADYTIITHREVDEDNDTIYQTFKCIMARGDSDIDYFAQPYEKDPKYHNFKIITDIDLDEPVGVERISDTLTVDDVNVIANNPKNLKSINKKEIDLSKLAAQNDNNDADIIDDDNQALELL